MSERFDLIVIGGGSAARDGALMAASRHGARVAIVERERWGGSCPNIACSPTKAYLVAAELTHDARRLAPQIGIDAGPGTVDLARVRAWKETLKKPQEQWVEDLQNGGLVTFSDEAVLGDPHTVLVRGDELIAERILVATGSRTAVPPIEGIDDVDWLDHISALELTEVPESLLVCGGGPVGLEFGQIFSRFGSKVTIVDALERIAPNSDAQASAVLHAALRDEGIEIATSVLVKSTRNENGEVVAAIAPRDGSDPYEVRSERFLLASGRVPNVEGLNLEGAGVETSKAGILVDDRMRTSAPGVWAAGDVVAGLQFTPVAQYQARVAVGDMFGADRSVDYTILPTAIFTDPELGGVGLTEQAARDEGHDVDTVTNERVKRFSFVDERHGLFKIVFDRGTRRVLGLHVVSRSASDIVQGFSAAMRLGLTMDDVVAMHHIYPTFGEGLKAAAERAEEAAVAAS